MVPGFIKNAFAKTFLKRFLDGDKGSTLLGTVAAALLGANLDFDKITHGLENEASAMECGKAAAIVLLAAWAWFIGRKKTGTQVKP
jgi:hypothetical protein